MSSYTVADGWLCVPYFGPNMATVHIAVGTERTPPEAGSDAWRPAFLDAPAGVVKVRMAERPKRQRVWLRVKAAGQERVERVT